MKTFLFFCIGMILSGCTRYVDIVDFDISKKNNEFFILKLVTNESLEKLKNSYWCYEPVVIYGIDNVNGNEKFPFSVKGWKETKLAESKRYKTEWELPLKKRLTIDETTYAYDYSGQDHLVFFVKLFGATMSGGHLDSDTIKVEIKK